MYERYEMDIVLFRERDEFAGCWDGSTYEGGKTDQESIQIPTFDS